MKQKYPIYTKCCNERIKADPKSNENWFVPRCSKCGSTKDILHPQDLMRVLGGER